MNIQDEDKRFVVYCHTNLINGKKYIGITCQSLDQRFRNGKGYKSSKHFNSAIQQYGWESFEHEILFEDLPLEEAKAKEIDLIKEYKTRDPEYGYNMTPGGEGYYGEDSPWFGRHHTEEARKKMSEKHKGVPKTEQWKKLMSKKMKGRVFSEETRRKMSENHADFSGKNSPMYGRKLSQEHIELLKRTSKTPEAIEKMKRNKVWYSGKDNPNAKRVMCVDTGIIYDTINEAAQDNGCNPSKISSVCHGDRKRTNHLRITYVDEKDLAKVNKKGVAYEQNQ